VIKTFKLEKRREEIGKRIRETTDILKNKKVRRLACLRASDLLIF